MLHRNWNFIGLNLLFLFRKRIRKSWFLMTEILWNRWHSYWWNAVRSMDHTTCYTLLMSVVCSLLWSLSIFSHMLEIKEATMSISMGLCLHHFKCLFILVTLSVHWTSPYHHLLILMTPLTLHILLVLHILIMIILLFLLHHHFHMLVEFHVFLVCLWLLLVAMLSLVTTVD